ncbi:MAG: enoyl-CoA hydratase [Rhodospirillaceae bacterium]|nr:enoyl-CoA hydratase [Rhodospirillaceae bacterium]|tara:strand:- start:44 stop:796 length:753 start_codon:yes stop_codon:yes gene_type:complete
MTHELVLYKSEDRIAKITINRPEKMNALSNALVAELRDAFIRFKNSEDQCAVLTSSGDKAFSVGADIKDPPTDPDLWECMPGVGVIIDKPVIAAVAGYCVGGAYCLVQFCDIAVAAENSDFFYPEAQLGFCGGLIASTAARIPHKVAMEFMLTGKHFDAQRALEVGMINKIVPVGKQVEAAMEYARVLADSAPLVVSMIKRFVRDTVTPKGPSELHALARCELLRIRNSDDQREGGAAFKEKRVPVFKGK